MAQSSNLILPLNAPLWYFAFGPQQKSSLISQYARQNSIQYLKNPSKQQLQENVLKQCILEADIKEFRQWQPMRPNTSVIFVGDNECFTEQQLKIKTDYQQIGRCKHIKCLNNYDNFRKTMYPNLIFFYGPNKQHSYGAASTIANQSGYKYIQNFPQSANYIISKMSKSEAHYTFDNLFTNPKQIQILLSRFNVRIVHFKYNRSDYPNLEDYFDSQYQIVNYLSGKSYFLSIDAHDTPENMMDKIGEFLCPKLTFINANNQDQKNYARKYASEKGIQILSIFDIQSVNKNKNIPLATTLPEKITRITSIIFNDLNAQQVVLLDFPWHVGDVRIFENVNRKFSTFVDLDPPTQYMFSSQYSSNIYFLETQRRIQPDLQYPLQDQIQKKIKYWIVNGPQGIGKTAVAKFLESQYNLKYIQFEPYLATLKEKLMTPEDGEDLPLKKIIAHFKDLIHNNEDCQYILDGFPYFDNDLKQWVCAIGSPFVINLKADDKQIIKRQRKKAQADIAAEISEQQSQKVTQLVQKQTEWVNKLNQLCNDSTIYNVDFNLSLMLAQKNLIAVLQPRVFLIQSNPTLVFQNAAIRNDCCLINLAIHSFEEARKIAKNCNNRNVIIANYRQTQNKLISQDLYWIEKNIGKIRYLAIWGGEDKQCKQEKIHLQRPVEVKKVKQPVQGEQQQPPQQQPAQEEGEENKKKKLDIYEYEWTKPLSYKNLSQWYFKLKKNIQQSQCSTQQTYEGFGKILSQVNNNPSANFYQVMKQK